eukprot:scaffold13391_cov65-Phaeocystis_antarctica.AAC.7
MATGRRWRMPSPCAVDAGRCHGRGMSAGRARSLMRAVRKPADFDNVNIQNSPSPKQLAHHVVSRVPLSRIANSGSRALTLP